MTNLFPKVAIRGRQVATREVLFLHLIMREKENSAEMSHAEKCFWRRHWRINHHSLSKALAKNVTAPSSGPLEFHITHFENHEATTYTVSPFPLYKKLRGSILMAMPQERAASQSFASKPGCGVS